MRIYPFSDTYSYLNGDLKKEEYREGIYVGYRYFDSYGVIASLPRSVTAFPTRRSRFTFCGLRTEETLISAELTVRNTGEEYAGREVVQILCYAA